jgi:glucose-6-phosphate 1-dehydrogenase
MVAMEAPVSFKADEIRNKKVDVLNAIRRFFERRCAPACRTRDSTGPAG